MFRLSIIRCRVATGSYTSTYWFPSAGTGMDLQIMWFLFFWLPALLWTPQSTLKNLTPLRWLKDRYHFYNGTLPWQHYSGLMPPEGLEPFLCSEQTAPFSIFSCSSITNLLRTFITYESTEIPHLHFSIIVTIPTLEVYNLKVKNKKICKEVFSVRLESWCCSIWWTCSLTNYHTIFILWFCFVPWDCFINALLS